MKKKLLTSAVSAALAAGVGIQSASADVVVAPFYSTETGSETFITVVTKGFDANSRESVPSLPVSWVYLTKDLGEPTQECRHSDDTGFQTPNDVGTFALGAGATLFDDTTSIGAYVDPGFAGMLVISNDDSDSEGSEGSLYGEQIVVDVRAGGIISQRLLNHPAQEEEEDAIYNQYGYNVTSSEGGVVPDPEESYGGIPAALDMPAQGFVPTVVWTPTNVLNTTWQVSALAADLTNTSVPSMRMEVALADSVGVPGFFYDRDENKKSTSASVRFDCIAQLKATDFVNPEQTSSVANGGWAHLQIVDGRRLGLLVYKIETAGSASIWTSENRFDF